MAQTQSLSPNQDIAANPSENVWVQANAGTGKTSVLVQRLLRILFRADDNSGGILCLTYTNAAAGEMRNRILSALRQWAMATDVQLRDMLSSVVPNGVATATDIAHAREIFFRYIDNPDYLKIKTIHGFCEEILHRFPIEAGISPAWELVSDANVRVLQQDAFTNMLNSYRGDNDRIQNAFNHIIGRVSEQYMDELFGILSDQYKYFFQVENVDKYREYFIDTIRYFLDVTAPAQTEISPVELKKIIENTQCEINSSKKPAKYLCDIITLTQQFVDTTIDFEKYKTAYLKDDGGKKPHLGKREYLAREQERVYRINQYNSSLRVIDDTMALFDLCAGFACAYRDIKQRRHLLDFEDLILYTRRLFSSPASMGWVLSQLNVRLSHILVDEAQDTSPMQWDILRMLAGDFFTDGDTNDMPHSLFVVGDTKQSIYGFQGADPRAFATSRDAIADQISNNMRTIREIPLDQSFRSTAAILRTVDVFFSDASVVEMAGFANNAHRCFRNAPGCVELHKLISKQSDDVDRREYINTIADKIQGLIQSGKYAARDIMVLVQNRRGFAAPIVAELKRRNIDVAGSDRIVLPEFPAVRDMLNLVRFCIEPTDDYSLCCVLKSPIYRLTEDDIFKICDMRNNINRASKNNEKPTTVFDVLRDLHGDIHNELCSILEWSKSMGPYSFFNAVLNHRDIRCEMIAALGAQIIDPVEEFMTICLAYERTMPGTLKQFLKWFVTGNSQIKRDMDANTGVRVVTVHGSKGLEAPVVFLVDTVRTPNAGKIFPITPEMLPPHLRARSENLPMPWLWAPRADDCARRGDAADKLMAQRVAEYYRLLYVAMTRARDCLYIYGFTPYKNAPDVAWHTMLWNVLGNMPDATVTDDVIRIENDNQTV